MLEEVLSWVALLNVKKAVTAQGVSSFVLLMYCLQYALTREARYLWAFLFCETFGLTTFSAELSDPEFYAGYAFIYMVLYLYCYAIKSNVKILTCCVIMVLFEIAMIRDAILYPNTYTFVWNNYASIILLIHCLFILQGTDLRKAGDTLRRVMLFLRHRYNTSFI